MVGCKPKNVSHEQALVGNIPGMFPWLKRLPFIGDKKAFLWVQSSVNAQNELTQCWFIAAFDANKANVSDAELMKEAVPMTGDVIRFKDLQARLVNHPHSAAVVYNTAAGSKYAGNLGAAARSVFDESFSPTNIEKMKMKTLPENTFKTIMDAIHATYKSQFNSDMKFSQRGYSLIAENQNLNGKENCSKNELSINQKKVGEVKAAKYHVSSGRYIFDYLNPDDGKVHEVSGFNVKIGMIPDYLVAAGKKAQMSAHLEDLEIRLPRNFPITVIHSAVDKAKITENMSRWNYNQMNLWKEPYPHTSIKKFAWYPFSSISDTEVQTILYFDPGFLLPLVEQSDNVVRGKSVYSRISLNEAIIEFKKVNKTEPAYRIYEKIIESLEAQSNAKREKAEAAERAKEAAAMAANERTEEAERNRATDHQEDDSEERRRGRPGTIGMGYDLSTGRYSPVLNIGGNIGISVGGSQKTYLRIGGSSYVR
ncbi:MAG: hypothetical protein RIR26_1551 [Pseudomonadota bacterium]